MSLFSRLAADRMVQVYPALGMHAGYILDSLVQDPAIELVDSPRHASVLLVAGGIPPEHQEALRRVHAQLPRPAASVWYRSEPFAELQQTTRVAAVEDLSGALVAVHRRLLENLGASEPHLLPNAPPHPWEGLGENGQGGEGMMGGVPYGRPMAMAMMDDLRDGLMLDSLSFTLGPFLPLLPPGLQLQLTLQGDLLQMAEVASKPYPAVAPDIFQRAQQAPVAIAALEIERARQHLRRIAQVMHLAGLDALARRTRAEALRLTPGDRLPDLRRRVRRSGLLQAIDSGVGRLDLEQAYGLGGVALRAAGIAQDARSEDQHYRQLGFEPVVGAGCDARARLMQRVAETEQALELAAAAQCDNLLSANTEALETPVGALADALRPSDNSHLLMDLLSGLEWSQALQTITSLDLAPLSPYPDTALRGAA